MAGRHVVQFDVLPRFSRRVRRRPLAALARRALDAEGAPPGALGIALTDDETVRALNARHLGRDEPTDVLSFAFDDGGDFVAPADAPRHLGDVVIAVPVAERQAAEAGHSLEDEIAHLLVHGVLHILGYDHERPTQARRMRAREEEILGRAAH
jgi:probable rRNA maturation factor